MALTSRSSWSCPEATSAQRAAPSGKIHPQASAGEPSLLPSQLRLESKTFWDSVPFLSSLVSEPFILLHNLLILRYQEKKDISICSATTYP